MVDGEAARVVEGSQTMTQSLESSLATRPAAGLWGRGRAAGPRTGRTPRSAPLPVGERATATVGAVESSLAAFLGRWSATAAGNALSSARSAMGGMPRLRGRRRLRGRTRDLEEGLGDAGDADGQSRGAAAGRRTQESGMQRRLRRLDALRRAARGWGLDLGGDGEIWIGERFGGGLG